MSNYPLAIEKFEKALKLDETYKLARSNLAIAYNNYGLQERSKPEVALKFFHKAMMLDPANLTTRQNVDGIIRMMGLDPKNFDDRVKLGEKAGATNDLTGAIVEYAAALDLQDSATVHEKLGDVYCIVDRNEKALEQYDAALALKNNFPVQLKRWLLRSFGAVSGISKISGLNSPRIALVAFPLLAALLAFATRKKRASIWFVGLAIASIFAVAGFFAL